MTDDDAIFTELNRLCDEMHGRPPAITFEAMLEAAEKLGATPRFISEMQEDYDNKDLPPYYVLADWLDVSPEKFDALALKAFVRIREGLDLAELKTVLKDLEEWDVLLDRIDELRARLGWPKLARDE